MDNGVLERGGNTSESFLTPICFEVEEDDEEEDDDDVGIVIFKINPRQSKVRVSMLISNPLGTLWLKSRLMATSS
jgi:hypothetical protein